MPPKARTPDILKPNVCSNINVAIIRIDSLANFYIASIVESSKSIFLLIFFSMISS